VPAAAIIPAPIAYINFAAVKKLVVWVWGEWCILRCLLLALTILLVRLCWSVAVMPLDILGRTRGTRKELACVPYPKGLGYPLNLLRDGDWGQEMRITQAVSLTKPTCAHDLSSNSQSNSLLSLCLWVYIPNDLHIC